MGVAQYFSIVILELLIHGECNLTKFTLQRKEASKYFNWTPDYQKSQGTYSVCIEFICKINEWISTQCPSVTTESLCKFLLVWPLSHKTFKTNCPDIKSKKIRGNLCLNISHRKQSKKFVHNRYNEKIVCISYLRKAKKQCFSLKWYISTGFAEHLK